jgi:hypothetical protein
MSPARRRWAGVRLAMALDRAASRRARRPFGRAPGFAPCAPPAQHRPVTPASRSPHVAGCTGARSQSNGVYAATRRTTLGLTARGWAELFWYTVEPPKLCQLHSFWASSVPWR